MSEGAERLDKWLWFARFFKTRTLANRFAAAGRVRINNEPTAKAHHPVRVGDVLTFPIGRTIRIVRVADLGGRRGPAPEAATLYADLTPPPLPSEECLPLAPPAAREPGTGRPTKDERRAIDRLRGRE